MNTGKICISICAKSAAELGKKIERAAELADLIEIRFDCLRDAEVLRALELVLTRAEGSAPLLATFRSPEEGGLKQLSLEDRIRFWKSGINKAFWGGDFEEDVIDLSIESNWRNRIGSKHQTDEEEFDAASTYQQLASSDASIIKVAANAEQAMDAIDVWNLLGKAKLDGKPMVPIAMGEAGKWTRILGLAHGAHMTYASLETGNETAPGQISAEDLVNVFRVNELSKSTEVYGIIAGDTSYTASPWVHNAAFKDAGMDRVFVPFQVKDLDEFMTRMVDEETREVELNFKGFSVTNPHKQTIIEHLHEIDRTAKTIGAVNTVKIGEGGKLTGYNTDAPGFIAPLIKAFGGLQGANVGIAGAGGAARACAYALKQEGANVTVFARRPKRALALVKEFGLKAASSNNSFKPGEIDILVNATPLGTKGAEEDATIATATQMQGLSLVYDLVYNPQQTRLIQEARVAGVPALSGVDMVLAQGRKQFEIWTGETPSGPVMRAAILKKLK